MTLPQAVVVHGLADVRRALAKRRPVTILSPPGAALFLGPAAWEAMIRLARAEHPDVMAPDLLDCAHATGLALAAIRLGLSGLVLWPEAPARAGVLAIASTLGAIVLEEAPPATTLESWLRDGPDDSGRRLR